MNRIAYRVTGISPMLMNNPASMVRSEGVVAKKTIPTPEEEAASKVYRLPSGQLYVPSIWAVKAITYGAKGLRIGKMFATRIIPGALLTTGLELPLVDPETGAPITEYEIDVQRAVVGRGASVLRARPRIGSWACDVALEYDEMDLSPAHITTFFEIAGRRSGFGDYRPEHGGAWGRFVVEQTDGEGAALAAD